MKKHVTLKLMDESGVTIFSMDENSYPKPHPDDACMGKEGQEVTPN
jgi:hypothetical protein